MSEHRHFPIYVVRIPPASEGCGHQHSNQERATNCAIGILHKRKFLSHANVIRIRSIARSDRLSERTVDTIVREQVDNEINV